MNLSAKEKISYGIGAVGKDMVYMLTASYILYFYEDILGVSAVFTGFLLLAARVFDAANDPVMGILVARTKSRFGRFRPWLFSGTIVNALVLYAMFAVPQELEGNPLLIYISAAYILWGVTYTMMDIPYWSMIPAFVRDSKERESLSTLGRTCAGIGSALVVRADCSGLLCFYSHIDVPLHQREIHGGHAGKFHRGHVPCADPQ